MMSNVAESETISSQLEELSSLERSALETLLKDKRFLFADGSAPDQAPRVCESTKGSHSVYRVDAKDIQAYLDDVSNIVERFQNLTAIYGSFFADSGILPPKADLRFLEVDWDRLSDESNAPIKLDVKCSIDLFHTKIMCPMELVFVSGHRSVDMVHAVFMEDFEIRIGNEALVNVNARNTQFKDDFAVISLASGRRSKGAASIDASYAQIGKRFIYADLILLNPIFVGTSFNARAVLRNTVFQLSASFRKAKFGNGLLVENCDFHRAPDFHDAVLHQDTSFQSCKFDTSTISISDVASFRLLKAHFGKMRDTKHELVFYALEHRAERLTSKNGILVSVLSWLYDEISEYGASIERTVAIFVLWNLDFYLLFFNLTNTLNNPQLITIKNEMLSTYSAQILTLQNIFNPLVLFSEKPLAAANSVALYGASLVQSVGSLAILTLMLFAIRGRFRKGGGTES